MSLGDGARPSETKGSLPGTIEPIGRVETRRILPGRHGGTLTGQTPQHSVDQRHMTGRPAPCQGDSGRNGGIRCNTQEKEFCCPGAQDSPRPSRFHRQRTVEAGGNQCVDLPQPPAGFGRHRPRQRPVAGRQGGEVAVALQHVLQRATLFQAGAERVQRHHTGLAAGHLLSGPRAG